MSKLINKIVKSKTEDEIKASLNKRLIILEKLIKKYKTDKEFRENIFLHNDIETNLLESLVLYLSLNKIDSEIYTNQLIDNYFNNLLYDSYLKKMFIIIKNKIK